MPHHLLPSLLLLIFTVGYTPGPANIYALSCSLRYGRRQALRMWLGLLTGFSIAVTVMAVLTHLLGEVLGNYVGYVKYAGAAYILYLAWKMYSDSGKESGETRACSFLSGMLVQLTNAKILLFDLTVFSTFVLPYSKDLADLLAVAAWLELAGPAANLAWIMLGAGLGKFFTRYRRQADIVMAACLAVCGVLIVI